MIMNQIAFYCTDQATELDVKRQLGLLDAEWVKDTVYADVVVNGIEGKSVAELQFNYSLGCELEILRYIEGPHWTQGLTTLSPYIAHIGIHLDDEEDWPETKWQLVQVATTYKHTAPHLNSGPMAGRRYIYRIYRVGCANHYVKYIKRRHPQ